MAEPTAVLTWNFANWITVLLMGVVGFAVIRLIYKMAGKKEE